MDTLHLIEKCVDIGVASLPRLRPKPSNTANACIIAHRGAHDKNATIQENTHAAFERAFQLGCYGIEFDVHATADDVLVVNHDPTLQRLWGHDIAIKTRPYHELSNIVPAMPLLIDVVANYGKRMHLFIELKAPFTAIDALVNALQSLTPCLDYHLLCLSKTIYPTLTPFPKESMLLVPVHNNVQQFVKLSLEHQYGGVLGHYLLLRNRHIKQLLAANQLAGVGLVDSKFGLYRELNRGMRLLFTNDTKILLSSLQALR